MYDFWKLFKEYEDTRLTTKKASSQYRYVIQSLEEYLGKEFFHVTPSDADLYAAQFETGKTSAPLTKTGDVRIRILKSIGTFMEEQVSGYVSPFTHLKVNRREKYKKSDLVSMETVDMVLSEAKESGNHRAFLAITLALRMCLSQSEILNLCRNHFYQTEDGSYFLNVPAASDYKERTIPVPSDVTRLLDELQPAFLLSKGNQPLFCNTETNLPISDVTLWKSIKKATSAVDGGSEVTLQNVRTLGIALLAQQNNELADVVRYSGIHEHWSYLWEGFKRDPIQLTSMQNITVHHSDKD